MVSIIAAVLVAHADVYWNQVTGKVHCDCDELIGSIPITRGKEHRAHQARAVLAALGEAGAVEWGVRVGPMPADPRKSKHSALNQISAYGYGTLVSRVTFPWERAE